MINPKLNIILIVLLLTGCKEKRNPDNESGRNFLDCYVYAKNKDTIHLQIITKNDSVTGELTFNFLEKDDNTGSIKGIMKGDTLFADYTFLSEGILSTREVAFIKVGADFKEAFGEMQTNDNKMVFTNPDALEVSDSVILKPRSCR